MGRELQAPQFEFLFVAALEGLELQHQIDAADAIGRPVMAATLGNFIKTESSDTPEKLAADAVLALSLSATTERLKSQLREKERLVGEQLAGMGLSVRVLDGDEYKPIRSTHFSSGAVGSRRQEFGNFPRYQRRGTFRAALLGQNALVLYPQRMSGQQMDIGNVVVPILRADGGHNIEVREREGTWRDRISHRIAYRYERRSETDLRRLRELAAQL